MPFNAMRSSKSMRDLLAQQEKEYPDSADAYQLLEACGRGVSGTVWRAKCKPLQEFVAVKLLDLESLNCRMEEVIHEAQTMCLAQHPNVLSLNTSFVSGKHLWMVMPYMPGGSALNIMRFKHPQGLDELTIAIIMKEVAKALEYVHKGGGIHRDVKAGNILVGLDGSVKLADFGVAATMERGGSWGNDRRGRETFVGTPCWMAPEVMEQVEEYNNKADIWSFGITLLELANGQAPFAKYPPMKVLLMTLQNPPPQLEEDKAGHRQFSKHMRDLVFRCLQKDPNKRPTAAQLLESRFFKNIQDTRYLATHLLRGLPTLTDRVRQLDQGKGKNRIETQLKAKEEYKKGVSAWDFDIPALKAQAAKELPILEESTSVGGEDSEASPAPKRPPPPPPVEPRPPAGAGMGHVGELAGAGSQGLGDDHNEGSERGDLPGSPLSGSLGSPTRQVGSPTRQTMNDRTSTMSESVGSVTGWSEKDVRSDSVQNLNGSKRPLGASSTKKSAKSSSRFVMLDEDAESRETKNGHHTSTSTTPHAASVSVASSGSLHDDLQPLILPRAHTENLDSTLESDAEKVAHHKVGRFDVGIKKESKTMPKHPSLKEISDLGKVPAYVPPATALLPRMMEMMEHFKDQYSAMQRMIEVITEADRGKALALQRLLAQPLFMQKTPDGVVVEERVLELEKKVKSLDADNRALRERNEQLEKQLAQVAAVASVVAAAGPN